MASPMTNCTNPHMCDRHFRPETSLQVQVGIQISVSTPNSPAMKDLISFIQRPASVLGCWVISSQLTCLKVKQMALAFQESWGLRGWFKLGFAKPT